MSEVLVKAENVSKKFCRRLRKTLWYGLKDMAAEAVGGSRTHDDLRPDEFWAVKDVSFEVRRGECLGLIGHNGAGKTTLLKMLNGLIKPDHGSITMKGRVGALIALGAGFNPILTGRENIFVNASVLGMSRNDVESRLDEIIEFSGIGDFIDSPVQNYSSGMSVRLGFSVAAILLEPDVLFLDEVLAVGDIAFTIKCLNAVRRMTHHSAVVLVSHSMQMISAFTTRVMVMDHGMCRLDSPTPADGIDMYYSMVQREQSVSGSGDASVAGMDLVGDRVERGDNAGQVRIRQGEPAYVEFDVDVHSSIRAALVNVYILDETFSPLVGVPLTDSDGGAFTLTSGISRVRVALGTVELAAGSYSFMIAVSDADTRTILCRSQGLCPFRVTAPRAYWAKIVRPMEGIVLKTGPRFRRDQTS